MCSVYSCVTGPDTGNKCRFDRECYGSLVDHFSFSLFFSSSASLIVCSYLTLSSPISTNGVDSCSDINVLDQECMRGRCQTRCNFDSDCIGVPGATRILVDHFSFSLFFCQCDCLFLSHSFQPSLHQCIALQWS